MTNWDPTTPTDLASLVTDFVNNAGLRDTSYNDWWTGSASGGPNNDGYYPINLFGGGTVLLPCPAKQLSQITHGADAETGIVIDVLGPYNNGELLRMVVSPSNLVIDPSKVVGYAITPPLADTTFVLKRNGANWGTVTFHANSHTNVTAIFSDNSLSQGQAVMVYAPAVIDSALQNFSFTIPGV